MGAVFFLGVFWTIIGIINLCGHQFMVIKPEYKNRSWTKEYIRFRGKSMIMAGVPWILLFIVTYNMDLKFVIMMIWYIVVSIPAFMYSIIYDRRYEKMLEEELGLNRGD